ncbi:MAG: hypothetical protein ACE5KV_09470, partial [Thermoplasmata archaeon]
MSLPIEAAGPKKVAYFRNRDPWGLTSNEAVMNAYGIPFDSYTSFDFGNVNLSGYDKILIASCQPYSFYQALEANSGWFESYIASGGIFEFHGATYSSDDWSGLVMPTGFTSEMAFYNDVEIVDPLHDIAMIPNVITDEELDGWLYSSHGFLKDIMLSYDVLIRDSDSGNPVAIEIFLQKGAVVATMQTLEWAYDRGYSPILENFIMYMTIRYEHDIAVKRIFVPDINERTLPVTVNATI